MAKKKSAKTVPDISPEALYDTVTETLIKSLSELHNKPPRHVLHAVLLALVVDIEMRAAGLTGSDEALKDVRCDAIGHAYSAISSTLDLYRARSAKGATPC